MHLSDEIMQEVLSQFQKKKVQKKGKISLNKLNKISNGKIENIEVNDKNIGSFIAIAKKYDINFSVKCDKGMNPPMWHVFFDTSETSNFKKAFSEYASRKNALTESKSNETPRRSVVERLENVDKDIKQRDKNLSQSKERNQNRGELSL